jgi:hypothetical protein
MTIKTLIVDITPAMAENWLAQDEPDSDRKLRVGWVDQLATDMKDGNFMLTHQGIAFNCDGKRLDGQHRLHAIVKSGTTQRMLVTTGLPREIRSVIDINKTRTLSDYISISDQPASKAVVQVTVSMYFGNNLKPRLTRPGQKEFFLKYRDYMEWAVDQLPNGTKIAKAGVRAAVARAYYNAKGNTQKISKIKRFCEILREGQTLNATEQGVRVLRDFLIGNKQYAGSTASVDVYSKTANALHKMLEGRPSKSAVVSSTNFFPIPEDTTA